MKLKYTYLNLTALKDKLLEKMVVELKKKYKFNDNLTLEESLVKELGKCKKAKSKQTKMFEVDAITIEEYKERNARAEFRNY